MSLMVIGYRFVCLYLSDLKRIWYEYLPKDCIRSNKDSQKSKYIYLFIPSWLYIHHLLITFYMRRCISYWMWMIRRQLIANFYKITFHTLRPTVHFNHFLSQSMNHWDYIDMVNTWGENLWRGKDFFSGFYVCKYGQQLFNRNHSLE